MKEVRRVTFRVGGSRRTGFGHVRRCLSLAEALRNLGAVCTFLIDGDPEVAQAVLSASFKVSKIDTSRELPDTIFHTRKHRAQVLIVDSYDFGCDYFWGLRKAGVRLVAIDDLAVRNLPVDLIVNATICAQELIYRESQNTEHFIGPSYALLRQEFSVEPRRKLSDRIQRVLITVGGSNPFGIIIKLMRWTREVFPFEQIDVVLGCLFEDVEAIQAYVRTQQNVILHSDPPNLHSLMCSADIAICGGGQTTYELAACGTPSVAIRLADNQNLNLRNMAKAGSLIWVGDVSDDQLEAKVKDALAALAASVAWRAELSRRGRELIDGHGAMRVAFAVMAL